MIMMTWVIIHKLLKLVSKTCSFVAVDNKVQVHIQLLIESQITVTDKIEGVDPPTRLLWGSESKCCLCLTLEIAEPL